MERSTSTSSSTSMPAPPPPPPAAAAAAAEAASFSMAMGSSALDGMRRPGVGGRGSRRVGGHVRHTSDPFSTSQLNRMHNHHPGNTATATTTSTTGGVGTASRSVTSSPMVSHPSHRQRIRMERHSSTSRVPDSSHTLSSHPSTTTIPSRSSATWNRRKSSNASNLSFTDIAQFQESWVGSAGSSAEFLGSSNSQILDASFSNIVGDPSSPSSGRPVLAGPGDFGRHLSFSSIRSINTADGAASAGGVSSAMHDAARITDWETVLRLCETDPEAASYTGRDGWTALHHACNRRCPHAHVVEALIKAYPEALLAEEEKGWLPLHYACRFKAPTAVVRLLLHQYPARGKIAVSRRERLGRTPLYYAIRYDAPEGVVGLLLDVDPSAVLSEDQMEDSPLALVWNQWAEKMEGKRCIHSYLPGGFSEPEGITVEERAALLRKRLQKDIKLLKRWKKVNMLLKAAFGFPPEDEEDEEAESSKAPSSGGKTPTSSDSGESQDQASSSSSGSKRQWRIVHATAAVKCHLTLFLLACALHPEQARELDECDLRRPGDNSLQGGKTAPRVHQTALHLAASSNLGGEPGKTVVINLLSLYREAAQMQDSDGGLPLHRMVENPCKQDWPNQTAILYHFYPQAVQKPDHQGQLPLHRAAAAIRHQGGDDDAAERSVVTQLVRAFPQATVHADASGCLPMHMLAMNAQVWDHDVDAVLNAHRPAVHARSGPQWHNRLPIHMAAASENSEESLIQRLVQLNPRGATLADQQGKLPFHLACEIAKDWEEGGVRCIYEAFTAAIHTPEDNERGWLPLHMAAASPKQNSELINKLVELYPTAACIPDRQGRYPLHLACASGKSWKGGLEILLEAYPTAISPMDASGRLPFHLAALYLCDQAATTLDDDERTLDEQDGDEATTEAEAVTYEETKEAREEANIHAAEAVDTLFHLLRADPTTLAVGL